jgi:hypothetical protein
VSSLVLGHAYKTHSSLDHILEYENHSGLDNAWRKIPGSEVRHAS